MPTSYGNELPITVPQLSDSANIVTALTGMYYGTLNGSTATSEDLLAETDAIAGHLQRLITNKANYTDNLGVFADTTSDQLLSTLTDATGTGVAVFSTSPTLVTPTLGVATATSINGTTIPSSKTLVTTADTGSVTSTMIADGTILNADISSSAAIVDTKLATISTAGKVSNSATTATNANTSSAIVARDSSGNFSAGTITANLTGNATSATNLSGGSSGQVPYQTATGTTAFTAAGDNLEVLQLNAGVPTWVPFESAGTIANATLAGSIAGGSTNQVLYQSAANTTQALAANSSSTKMFLSQTSSGSPSWSVVSKTDVGLSNVENTALTTWTGNTAITSVGTIATGTWNATAIADGKIASALTGKTYNGLTITSSTGTLSITNGKTLAATNSLTLSGTDSSTLNIGTGGTLGSAAFLNTGTTSTTVALGNHVHGGISSTGAIGTTAGLMIKTTTSGVLTALAAGTSGEFLKHDGTWGAVDYSQVTNAPAEYTPTAATAADIGGIKLGSDTAQSVAASAVTATASRTYASQLNASGQLVVNVPWSEGTYFASTGAATTSSPRGKVFVSPTAPSAANGAVAGDLWFW